MKQRILIAVVCVVLAAVILLLLPPAHPQVADPTQPTQTRPTNTQPSTPNTNPSADHTAVRLYSCNEAWTQALEALATQYTEQAGMEVVVLRPQEDGCQATLTRLMQSEDPPTVLCVHSQRQLESWKESLLDLQGTGFGDALCAASFGLYAEGKLMAVPMDLEGFGLLVNAEVLATKGALSRNDITDSQTLSMAVQILKDNSVKAFPAAQLDAAAALHLLLTGESAQVRTFLELYAANGHTSGDAQEQFRNGQCAFYLGGTWNYDALVAQVDQVLQVRNLDILPTYLAGSMQYIFSTAWCVNGSARQEDVDATLAFLAWLVSAGEDGTVPVDALQTLTPFSDGTWYGNQLEKKLLAYRKTEPAFVHWAVASDDYTKLLTSLEIYLQKRTSENWDFLQTILKQVTNKS